MSDTQRIDFLLLPEGEDPDSLVRSHGSTAFDSELSRALPLSRWFVQCLADDKDMGTAEGRAAFLAESKPLLQSMPPGALRLQLVRELAEAARSAPSDVESLFGLQPWRRVQPVRHAASSRRQPVEASDLKQHILQRLLALPELVREFGDAIAREFADGVAPVDRQICEVWRTASMGERLTSGALQELLADSDFAPLFRDAAARELMAEADADIAREELAAGFAKLELRRVNEELQALAAQSPLSPDSLAQIRLLSERRSRLMAGARPAGEG